MCHTPFTHACRSQRQTDFCEFKTGLVQGYTVKPCFKKGLFISNMYAYDVCGYNGLHVEVRGQLWESVLFPPSLHEFQGLKSSCKDCGASSYLLSHPTSPFFLL